MKSPPELKLIEKPMKSPPETTGRKSKRWTWSKPEGMPKRPLSAYNIFFKHVRSRIVRGLTEEATEEEIIASAEAILAGSGTKAKKKKDQISHGKIGFRNLASVVSEQWRNTSEDRMALFQRYAERDRLRYFSEVAIWKAKKQKEQVDTRPTISLSSSSSSSSSINIKEHKLTNTNTNTNTNTSTENNTVDTTEFDLWPLDGLSKLNESSIGSMSSSSSCSSTCSDTYTMSTSASSSSSINTYTDTNNYVEDTMNLNSSWPVDSSLVLSENTIRRRPQGITSSFSMNHDDFIRERIRYLRKRNQELTEITTFSIEQNNLERDQIRFLRQQNQAFTEMIDSLQTIGSTRDGFDGRDIVFDNNNSFAEDNDDWTGLACLDGIPVEPFHIEEGFFRW